MLHFSLILPAYNEAARLPPYLAAIRPYLDGAFAESYEVIVVDDGSGDGLAEAVAGFRAGWPQLTLMRHEHNRGKGASLRTGLEAARGELILFADADGATPIGEEVKLRQALGQGASVAVGSRLLHRPEQAVSRTLRRNLMGQAFAWLARILFGLTVRDTQCGFKMFRRAVALALLPQCRETGYLFDLEILARAQRLGYRIAEVPISWRDVPGSKVRLLRDGGAMLRGLFRLRRACRGRALFTPLLSGPALPRSPEARG